MYSLILLGKRSTDADDVIPRDAQKEPKLTVSYLVDSVGIPIKFAESILKEVSSKDKCNPNSVLNLLRSYDFTDSQISSIITTDPELLMEDAENSLCPKLKFLESREILSSRLNDIVTRVPKILRMEEEKSMITYYDFVKTITLTSSRSDFYKVCELYPYIESSIRKVIEMGFDPFAPKIFDATVVVCTLSNETLEERVNIYKTLGFDVRDVWEMFKKCPTFLNISEKKITQSFETLKKCGLVEEEVISMFQKSPQCIDFSELDITQNFEFLKGCGLVEEEVLSMFKRYPQCIGFSEKKILNAVETFLGQGFSKDEVMMMVNREGVVSIPVVLEFSMEKMIVPRCNVIKALTSKRLLKTEVSSMFSVLICPDEVFLERYVSKHDDQELVDELMSIFTKDQ
ncbi:Mitochondrial transcription termination factor family protein [Arabidopsis thaliana]|uniref:Mitochondrial transcription termination factor family protein n=1 Tax=Arabidopsis thaliana TaxID=3702 RepID=F4I534_ARATH|nr:Mitochondrial transcription termination factor family protein [Arabidopsis thaliana]AEE33385.1 Mitochondrial transcription termination factor family protein [Arabidopsis thaliana]|eukprot:NP_001154432.1 Mitochondrial transcription termination factor family protein [Arabidopsis thaliana]